MNLKTISGSMLLLVFLQVLSIKAYSDTESKEAKLNQLANIMDMDSMVEGMYSQMEVMMQNMSTEMGVQPNEQAIFDEYYTKMVLVMREEMSWKKMEPHVLDIYRRNFSETEIDDMLAFYSTETGKALLEKMPVVMQESMQMSQSFAQQAIPRIQEVAEQLAIDLEKSRSAE